MVSTELRPLGTAGDDPWAADVLVFARQDAGLRLIGGSGRGAGWAEIVEVGVEDEPLIERAWRLGVPIRIDTDAPTRIAGPYWACHGVIVPVGDDHLVIFGSPNPITASDAVIVRVAAETVAQAGGASAEKLLGDELELVHALRSLMAYRPETVRDTARHIARVAARSLSCDVAVVQVDKHGVEALEAIYLGENEELPGTAGPEAADYLRAAAGLTDLRVEQSASADPNLWQADVVSRLTVPLGPALGAFALGHAASRPRGFTLLCQRIARALAESAELLLEQAIAREALAAERDLLQRISRTDALTGLLNRTGWDEVTRQLEPRAAEPAVGYSIMSADLDGLKAVNDRHGHPAGDALIKAAANLLQAATRSGDTVARVGGDEFLVLLPGTEPAAAGRIAARVRRLLRRWQVADYGLAPQLSIGWSGADEDGVQGAIHRADQRMYALKRRRRLVAAARAPLAAPVNRRRVAARP